MTADEAQQAVERALDALFDDDDACACTTCQARATLEALDRAGVLTLE